MKKLLFSLLLISAAGACMTGCNNGDYSAKPSGGINPLNPPGGIDNSFSWSGNDPMSAEINGNAWKADEARMDEFPIWPDSWFVSGYNYSGDTTGVTFVFKKNVKAGNTYPLYSGNTDQAATYIGKYSDPNFDYISTLTTVGELKIIEHDATHIKAMFFFLAKNPENGEFINIQKGYFNVNKP